MTQDELSQKADIGRSTISNIETGRYIPGVDVALRLAHALGKIVDDLFEIEGVKRDDGR